VFLECRIQQIQEAGFAGVGGSDDGDARRKRGRIAVVVHIFPFGVEYRIMHYVIAYDVVKAKRRTKIMNRLKDNGLRIQYSVFEVETDAARGAIRESQMSALIAELKEMIEPKTDRLHVYRLCESCFLRSEAHGAEQPRIQ
jgi:CRISPR-associated protein Cas2